MGLFLAILAVLALACEGDDALGLETVRALQSRGEYQQSIAPLLELLAREPESIELSRLYGRALLAIEGPSAALWRLRKVAESPDRELTDVFLYARALGRGGAYEEAIAVLDQAIEVDPDNPEAVSLRGAMYLDMGDWENLLASSEQAIRLRGQPSIADVWRATALANLDREEEALEGLARAERRTREESLRPTLCKARIDVADIAGEAGRVSEEWDRCLELWPAHPDFIEGAVAYFDSEGNGERTREILEAAIAIEPRNVGLRAELARRLEPTRPAEAEGLLLQVTQSPEVRDAAWLALAELYRQRGDFPESISAAATALDPLLESGADGSGLPVMLLAQYADDLIQGGELDRAEQVITHVERPEYASLLRGRLLLARGEAEQALAELEEGLRLWPANSGARWLAAQAAERVGDFDRAIGEYRNALRGDIESDDALFRLAELYEREGNLGAALYVVQLRLIRVGDEVRAHREATRLGLAQDNPAPAERAIEALVKLPDATPDLVLAKARLASFREGVAGAARAARDDGIELWHADQEPVLRFLVDGFLAEGRHEDAARLTREMLSANAGVAHLHAMHADALAAGGASQEELEAVYRRSLELDEDLVAALLGLARLRAEAGRVDEALALYARARAADQLDVAAVWNSIELQRAGGRNVDLDAQLDELLQVEPTHPAAAELRARRLLAQGELERAERLSRTAVRFQGGGSALEALGLVALAREEPVRAARAFRRSLALRPESPSTQFRLGLALRDLGDAAGARRALTASLDGGAFPEREAARAALEALDGETNDG